ncbi:MAG: IclR family transcriptional regulator domain-containing protein [Jiangellaceae bacterium]
MPPVSSSDDTGDTPRARPADFVQSLDRGLAVIRVFDEENRSLTLSDVARLSGLTRAAARRFLHTLVEHGYVLNDGRQFRLGPRVLDLGYAYLSSLTLPDVAQPHLERLSASVGESTSVSVLAGDEIVYVARVAARRIMTVAIGVGTRLPAYATSMGRVLLAGRSDEWLAGYLASARLAKLTPVTITEPSRLLAELARVRDQGWALVDQELEEGLRSIAAPIRDVTGAVVAAINISAPVRRGSSADIVHELLPPLRHTAAEIQTDLAPLP